MISQTLINLDASHLVNVQRYGTKLANDIIPFINDLKSELAAVIAAGDGSTRTKRRNEQIIAAAKKTIDEYLSSYASHVSGEYLEFVEDEIDFVDDSVLSVMSDVESATPSPEQVMKAATTNVMQLETGAISYESALSGWIASEKSAADRIIRLGFSQGMTSGQISNLVNRRVAGAVARNARTIVRTSINHLANQTRQQYYSDNDDFIIGYRIVATLDARTTPICRKLDQKVVKNSDAKKPMPPFHFGCRTSTTPEIDGRMSFLKEDAKRAAEGGQVSATKSYYQWLKEQSAALQDEVLGKTKGKIFRNAGLTTEEFKDLLTDRYGQELTLSEMKAKSKKVKDYLTNTIA